MEGTGRSSPARATPATCAAASGPNAFATGVDGTALSMTRNTEDFATRMMEFKFTDTIEEGMY